MRNGGDWLRAVSRFAIVGVVGGVTSACTSDRMAGGNPLSNPFSSEPTRTGSLAAETPPAAAPFPRSTVSSQPIAPIQSGPVSAPAYPSGSASAPAAQPRTASGGAGWSTSGGTTVIVGPGETLTTLSSRYGVPGDAILSANSLKQGDVAPGRRVVIPVYSASGNAPAPARRAEVVAPAPSPVRYNAPPAPMPARVVASQKIDVKKEPPRTVAEAAPPKSQLRPGQAKVAAAPVPARVAEAKPAATPAAKPPVQVAKVEPKAAVKVAKAEPAQKEVILPARKIAAKPAAPAPKVEVAKVEPKAAPVKIAEPVKAPVRDPETTASLPAAAPPSTPSSGTDFRWPARGRVISGFGGGGSNEGINIAVPEGTAVKAAGDGVVAYAGSEVKGYGNLVLIRHDNGYVSAYANNGQIDVKRGQRVNRGQAIAKSGQTGNVTSPQLHFEIRKGSTPVDPMKYLASAE